MAGPNLEPYPGLSDASIKDKLPALFSRLLKFDQWFTPNFTDRVQASPPVTVAPPAVSASGASIGATTLIAAANAGLYRVSWWLRITQAASVSSSVTVTLGTTDGGVACTLSGPALTANNVALPQGESRIIRADGAALISYSTTYVSVGTPALYDLEILVEAL